MLKVTDTASILVGANKDAAVDSAKIIAGDIISQRALKIITPKLPLMVRSYVSETEIGKAAVSNLIAGVLIHTLPNNKQAQVAAEALIASASLRLAQSLKINELIDELLDGVPGLNPEGV